MTRLFCTRAIPVNLRSDSYSEFTNTKVRTKQNELSAKTLFTWEIVYIESFNGKMRDELLNRGIFYTLKEAKGIIEQWRCEYISVGLKTGDRSRTSFFVAVPLRYPMIA